MQHVELMMLAGQEWLKMGRLLIHKVSALDKSGRSHDHGHGQREKLLYFRRTLNLRGSFFADLGQHFAR